MATTLKRTENRRPSYDVKWLQLHIQHDERRRRHDRRRLQMAYAENTLTSYISLSDTHMSDP